MLFKKNKEMVKYWMERESVPAIIIRHPDGHHLMQMDGEKYPMEGVPRGALLYGKFSPLKHHIKNKIFNDIWAKLESNEPIRETFDSGFEYVKEYWKCLEYDQTPPENLVPMVKEVWRAFSTIPGENVQTLKKILCFILQEDDAYRYRLGWFCKFLPRWFKPKIKHIEFALSMMEHGEMVGDMKERQRLFARVIKELLKQPDLREKFDLLLKEMDWNKLRLTKADKYFFRAKYFKVDYPEDKY